MNCFLRDIPLTDTPLTQSTADHLIDDTPRHLSVNSAPLNKGFLPDLPREAAHTHMGLYLGWALSREMMSHKFLNEHARDAAAFKENRLTGPQLAGRLSGVLRTSMFNDEIARFSRLYYSKMGRFYNDYIQTFIKPITQARSMYVVADSQENQNKLSLILDTRLQAWRVYPPAAARIFGKEVGIGSYQELEIVTQVALLVTVKALMMAQTCRPFLAFLTPSNDVRVPQALFYKGHNIDVMTDGGIATAAECLREGLKLRTVKAFCIARLQSNNTGTPVSGVEVIAQHFKSGPHRVLARFVRTTTGDMEFELPELILGSMPTYT
jgi:hypothetical protein